jgi:hypothetical protein
LRQRVNSLRLESFRKSNQAIEDGGSERPGFGRPPMPAARHASAQVLRLMGPNRTEEKIMGIIMINCPATGRGVSTGIEVCATDQLPVVTAATICPACGRVQWGRAVPARASWQERVGNGE